MNYETLQNIGVDVDALLKRLMGNAALIRVFFTKFLEDPTMQKLQSAFAEQDLKAAEMASHTLKGMCGNLSLIKLYALFTEQVNLLRANRSAEAEAMMPAIMAAYQYTIDGIKDFLAQS